MSAGGVQLIVRAEIQHRRQRRRLTDAMTDACRGLVGAARALDEACERRHALWLSDATTFAEDQAAEAAESAAWERCFVAAITLDDVLPDPEQRAAEVIKVMAQLAARASEGWHQGGCVGGDGSTHVAYHDDGRGRVTATLTAAGEVVATRRIALGWPLPKAPA